ncbi:uncharacterized protein [Antedon mediterranea]|uniref:uncharacterized protein n=1 Tax=Antedon mediterranea TaxID=105859 RepID=UPI003AF70423
MSTLFGFGYNGFAQISDNSPSTTTQSPKHSFSRFISTPSEIFRKQLVNGTFKIVIKWSSIHLLKDQQVICASKSCPCCFSKSVEDFKKLKLVDVDLNGIAGYVISCTEGLTVMNGYGCHEKVDPVIKDSSCTFKTVSVGDTHVVATKADDTSGEIIYTDSHYIYRPLSLARVCQVTCGKEHVLILTESGDVYSFGIGSRGQLGHGIPNSEKEPRVIEALQGIRVSAISCGGWHSAALSAIGDIYIWGWNESGQLGFPMKSKPTLKAQHKKFITADSYYPTYCDKETQEKSSENIENKAEQSEHEILNYRTQSNNKLESSLESEKINEDEASCSRVKDLSSHGDVALQFAMIPSLLDFPDDITVSKVSCGSRHSAAVLENGDLYTWGWGKYGQLGHDDTNTLDQPTQVKMLQNKRVTDVVCGAWNTVIVCETPTAAHCQTSLKSLEKT